MKPDDKGKSDAALAIDHLKRVSTLADNLRSTGAAIYEHHWDCLCFGSWTISAGRRMDCFEFSWDGREFFLTISHSNDLIGGRPHSWHPLENHRLSPDDGKDPIAFIDEFFRKRQPG